ncbi:MAG: folate-binding protein [Hyphomicrobiales bacterium]|nr:folate-binding protein [Hyphomicrobiales bacterium]
MTHGNSTIARLNDRGIVEVAGPDSASFLHNLLTNNIEQLKTRAAAYAALLSPKGKILFDFLVYRRSEDRFLLDCAKEVTADFVKKLTLYKLRANITVTDRSDELAVGAIWAEAAALPATEGLEAYDDPRFAPLGQRFVAPASFWATQPGADDENAASAYHQRRIAFGIPEGGRDFAFGDAFPHDACFDALNGVDYRKGCYIGQEVVSRMHHKGTAKSGVVIIEADDQLPESGAEIHAGDSPAGHLGSVDGARGIAIVRLDRIERAQADGKPIRAESVNVAVKTPPWLAGKDGAP